MEELKNLEKLDKGLSSKVAAYMNDMLSIHGDNIVSIFAYGACAGEDFIQGATSVSTVIVFKELGFTQLKQSLKLVDRGIRKGIAAPLFLTPEHIKSSSDTFPIEFLEMKDKHVLIFGEDLLSGLAIELSHIRFICEEQLKGKLIRIRQAYLEIGLRKKGMEALIKESLDSLFPVFRGLLRLKGIVPPIKKEDIARSLSDAFGVDYDTFIAVLKDEKNDEKIAGEELESFLERYIQQIEKLAIAADQL